MADTRALDIKVSMNQGELDAGIKVAKRLVSEFTSEIRRSDAEMKAFGKTSDSLGTKKESLNKKLEAQNKQMELLQASYEKQVKAGNDTSQQTIKLKRDINNLAGQMAKTESEIEAVTAEMEDYTDVAGKAGTSTVSLYKKIGEADQQLKTYESELKKANSEVKVFGETNETLGNKMVALGNVYDGQKTKMDALKEAYDREVQKSGEASASAQKLSQEMNNLESAMNVTKGEIDKTSGSMEELGDVSGPTADQIDTVQASLNALVMDRVVQYLDTVADKLLDVGKNAVLAAADIEAHDSLFQQVFERMSDGAGNTVDKVDEAYKKIQEVSEYSGRMPTSLEEGFLQLSQQFMSVDTESELALNLATRSMQAATDASAAYNLELGHSQDLIQSFIAGNNKAGKSVGIFATETQLMEFAVEKGYINIGKQQEQFLIDSQLKVDTAQQQYQKTLNNSKSTAIDVANAQNRLNKAIAEQEEGLVVSQRAWTDLDSAIKQEARVAYIEQIYGSNGVMGQARNEMYQWETTINNLKEAHKRLNKELGEAALEMLLPIIRGITDALVALTEWFSNLSPGMKRFITIIAVIGGVLMKALVIFGKLSVVAGMMNTTVALLIKGVIAAVGPWLLWIAAIGLVVAAIMNSESAMAWLRNAWQVTVDFLKRLWDSIAGAFIEVWDNIKQWIQENQESIQKVIEHVWNAILLVIDVVMKTLVPMFQGTWMAIKGIVVSVFNFLVTFIGSAFKIIWGVIEVFLKLLEGDWKGAFNKLLDLVVIVFTAIKDVLGSLLKGAIDIVIGLMFWLSSIIFGILQGIFTIFKGVWNGIKDFVLSVLSFIVKLIVSILVVLAQEIALGLSIVAEFFSDAWEKIKFATAAAWKILVNTVVQFATGIYNAVVEWIGSVATWWSGAWTGIKDFFSGVWQSIKDILESVKTPIDNVIGYFQGLWESAKSVFDNLKEKVSDTWNSVKDTIGKLNPANWFGSQHVMRVSYDTDPYSPAIGGFNIPNSPAPVLSSAVGSLMSATGSIIGGMNSAFNNLNGIYESGVVIVNAPQERNDRNQAIMSDRLDSIERLLTIIAEKELRAFLDTKEVTSKLYNPMQNETELRDMENSRTMGRW